MGVYNFFCAKLQLSMMDLCYAGLGLKEPSAQPTKNAFLGGRQHPAVHWLEILRWAIAMEACLAAYALHLSQSAWSLTRLRKGL